MVQEITYQVQNIQMFMLLMMIHTVEQAMLRNNRLGFYNGKSCFK